MAFTSEVYAVSLVGRPVVSWAFGSSQCSGPLSIFLPFVLVGYVPHLILCSPWLGVGTQLGSSG